MNVLLTWMTVMKMQGVRILLEVLPANVILATREMEVLATVVSQNSP